MSLKDAAKAISRQVVGKEVVWQDFKFSISS